MDEGRLRVVRGEHGVDIRRPLGRGSLARQQRDRPALPVAVHPYGRGSVSDEVRVRDLRDVDTARGREAVPLPQAGVDLHQLEASISWVPFELHLRDAAVVERTQEAQRRIHDLLYPDRLADTARTDPGRRLPELAAAENAQRLAVGVD